MNKKLLDKIVRSLPLSVRIVGHAIGRVVFFNEKILDETGQRNYNWGYSGSSPLVFASDLLIAMGCSKVEATFLSHTLVGYIIQHLPDNFEIEFKAQDFLHDVTNNMPDSETKDMYNKHVVIVSAEKSEFVEIGKENMRPITDTSTSVMGAEKEAPLFIDTEFGRQRADAPKKVLEALDAFRNSDPTKNTTDDTK